MASKRIFIKIEGKTAWDDLDPQQQEAEIRKQHTETLSGLVKEYETENGRPVSPEEFATFSAMLNEGAEQLIRAIATLDMHKPDEEVILHQWEVEFRKRREERLPELVKEYETEKGRPVSPEEFATFSAWVNEETERLFRDLTTFDIHNQEVDFHQWEAKFRKQQEERLAKLVKENETEKGRPLSPEEFAELSAKVNEVTERVIRAQTPFDVHKPVEEVDFHQWEPKVRKWYEEQLAEIVNQYETLKGKPISLEELAGLSEKLNEDTEQVIRARITFDMHRPIEDMEPKVRKWYEEKLAEMVKQYETSAGRPISLEEFARVSAFVKQVAVWTNRD